jgi:hypothetical protein
MITNTWKSIFAQSPANSGYYDETELPHSNWDWPKGTWFQERRNYVRERRPNSGPTGRTTREEFLLSSVT